MSIWADPPQEVKRLTDALVKDAKKIEKEQVGMGEKKKHLSSKEKKLKKSISDVGNPGRTTS